MNLIDVDPAKLRHFIAVLDTGSFARAAQATGISQPAISKSIRALEHAVDMRLFERGRAGARATSNAELLAGHARVILAEYALAEAELRALNQADQSGLAIGASLSLVQTILPQAIARFRRRWPDEPLSVEVGFSQPLYEGLLSGNLDLVLSAPEKGVVIDTRLSRTLLSEEMDALVVGANHPLLERDRMDLGDLLDFPWIVPRRSTRLDHIQAVFAANRLPPPAYMLRSESSELARSLLTQEPYICLIGKAVLQTEINAGALATLPELGLVDKRLVFLARRRSSHQRPAARNFGLVLQEMVAEAQIAG